MDLISFFTDVVGPTGGAAAPVVILARIALARLDGHGMKLDQLSRDIGKMGERVARLEGHLGAGDD